MEKRNTDGRPPVIGGKARTNEPIPYYFYVSTETPGVQEIFNVTEDGRLKGYGSQICAPGTITIHAVDARGAEVQ